MAQFPSNIQFNPQAFRGAFNLAPTPGSSNVNSAVSLAGQGTWGALAGFPGLQIPPGFFEAEATKKNPAEAFFNLAAAQSAAQQLNPEYQKQQRQQALEDQLAYAKAQGDQMMKYRMTNDIIANLGSAARAAFAQYTDPYAIARNVSGIGAAYTAGLEASRGLTQLGAGQPEISYYKV